MSAARQLTDKPIATEVVEEDGRTVAVHLGTVITDPTSADAVQVPSAVTYPTANATAHNDLADLGALSPADALDPDDAGVNEVQTVDVTDTESGTFTLTFGGETTDDIAFDATTAELQAALVALSTIGQDGEANDNVTVTGTAGAWIVTFVNDLGAQSVAELTGDDANLVGAGADADVETTVEGAA